MESGFAILRIGLAALIATSGCLTAQTPQQSSSPKQSGIHLAVTDQSGAVIPDSKVAVLLAETPIRVEGKTDLAGTFQSPPLGPGKYSVTVEQFGFKIGSALVDLGSHETRAISITLLVAPTDIGSGSNPSYSPGVETITSTLDDELLPMVDDISRLGGGAAPLAPTQPKPRPSAVKRFFSSVGHKLGF